jgi:hypothetical protein
VLDEHVNEGACAIDFDVEEEIGLARLEDGSGVLRRAGLDGLEVDAPGEGFGDDVPDELGGACSGLGRGRRLAGYRPGEGKVAWKGDVGVSIGNGEGGGEASADTGAPSPDARR